MSSSILYYWLHTVIRQGSGHSCTWIFKIFLMHSSEKEIGIAWYCIEEICAAIIALELRIILIQ